MNFNLIYDGIALENNEFDVRDLSVSLLSINDLLHEANFILNQDRCTVKVKVKSSFKTGSFQIDFNIVQSILDAVFDNVVKPVGIIGALVKLVDFIKWLKGGTPEKIIENSDGSFKVYKSDKYIKVEKEVIKLYENYKIKKEFEKLLEPLEREGINSLVISTLEKKERKYLEISDSETNYFRLSQEEDLISQNQIKTNLSLISLSFKEGNKWKVSDGNNTFHVQIKDSEFLKGIDDNSISFKKYDIIKVLLMEKQYLSEGKLRKEVFIEKVLDHKHTEKTQKLAL